MSEQVLGMLAMEVAECSYAHRVQHVCLCCYEVREHEVDLDLKSQQTNTGIFQMF